MNYVLLFLTALLTFGCGKEWKTRSQENPVKAPQALSPCPVAVSEGEVCVETSWSNSPYSKDGGVLALSFRKKEQTRFFDPTTLGVSFSVEEKMTCCDTPPDTIALKAVEGGRYESKEPIRWLSGARGHYQLRLVWASEKPLVLPLDF